MSPPPFTTADANRLLGLADQFLEDWKQTAKAQLYGEVGPDYIERRAEWEAIRPVLVQAPALHALIQEAVEAWGPAFAADEDISGSLVVEWMADWLPRAQAQLTFLTPPNAVSGTLRLNVPRGPA